MAILPCPQATTALQGRYLQQFLDAVHQAGNAQVGTFSLCCNLIEHASTYTNSYLVNSYLVTGLSTIALGAS